MEFKTLKIVTACSMLLLAAPAFAQDDWNNSNNMNNTTTQTTATTTTQVTNSKTIAADAKILDPIIAINQNEVLTGIEATHKASASNVIDYAKMLVEQHGLNLVKALELAGNKAQPSKDIQSKGEKEMSRLATLTGSEFDKAYIDAMVKGHQEALNLIDNKLLKKAKTDEMKTYLTDTRNSVARHLEEAKQIQSSLQ